MSEFKGTPGPWEVMNSTDIFGPLGGDSGDGANADDNDGWQICDCAVGLTMFAGQLTELGRDVRLANAKLIAAAPDLLESLQQIVSAAYRLDLVHNDDSRLSLEVSRAEHAINKALGR